MSNPTDKNISIKETKKRLLAKTRAGVPLSKEEVQEIKKQRRLLKKELRKLNIRKKEDFEVEAVRRGYYFDKGRDRALWLFWRGKIPWILLLTLVVSIGVIYLMSYITQLRGHFSVNLKESSFQDGLALSIYPDFEEGTSTLYSGIIDLESCISISSIPDDVDQKNGTNNGLGYFAYSFYVKNVGKHDISYEYTLDIISEYKNASTAIWVMLFEDNLMTFYAKANEDGSQACIPVAEETGRGYPKRPMYEFSKYPDLQYSEVQSYHNTIKYYRINPFAFESDNVVLSGKQDMVQVGDVHRYTLVIWLEGDDPDCIDELIGGHFGVEMNFTAVDVNVED